MIEKLRQPIVIFLTIFTIALTAFASESIILTTHDYFQTTLSAINQAQDSIYIAMYLINVESALDPKNPASALLDALITAHTRGVRVKVILDDSITSNYNAYKRLRQAGIDVSQDSPQSVLHGKALVIDSRISILGSFNWSRASLTANHEFAAYIEDPRLAQTLLDDFNRIRLSPQGIPLAPPSYTGIKLPISLLTQIPKPPLSELFTNRSEKAFDLYLYLLKVAQRSGTTTLKVNYKEFARALGYSHNYFVNVIRPLRKLDNKYHLIKFRLLSKTLTVIPVIARSEATKQPRAPQYILIPDAYWDYGLDKKLKFHAKYLFLVSLAEAQTSQRNPYWFRSREDLSELYQIGTNPITQATTELEAENILEVYRHKPVEPGDFEGRSANNYRLNHLQSEEQFRQALQSLSDKYGADITQKARALSSQLNEPKDLRKIETYIGLINAYGYERVEEANFKAASARRETGFHDLSQVILLLK